MRPFLIGFGTIAAIVVIDMYSTGGLYTAKFMEMGRRILQSFGI